MRISNPPNFIMIVSLIMKVIMTFIVFQCTYTDAVGSVECHFCGAGNYSPNVLSCLPCPVGECRRRVARVSPPDGPHAAS